MVTTDAKESSETEADGIGYVKGKGRMIRNVDRQCVCEDMD